MKDKGIAIVQWVNRLRNNIFVNRSPTPSTTRSYGRQAGRQAGRRNTVEF